MEIVNTKLISLINSFTPGEIEQFKKFISSPFFSKGRNYLPFLEHVLKISSNSIIKKYQNRLKPDSGKKFSEQTLRNRYSELYKLGEEFLIYTGLNENRSEKEKLLLKKLIDKKLYVHFNIRHKESVSILMKEKYDNRKFKDLSSLTELNFRLLHDKNKPDQIYSEYYETSKTALCLDLIDLFEYGYEFAQQEFDNRKFDPNYILVFLKKLNIEEIIKEFLNSDQIIFKVTALNYYLYKAFENEDIEEYYFKSHKIFTELFTGLKDDYKVKIFNHMINYCIRKRNKGVLKYEQNLFDLYNEKLNQNLISDLKANNYLFNYFRDYVLIGISIKNYSWVENFIAEYSLELPPEIREDETRISYAKLYFAKRKFEKSLLNLQNIKTTYYLLYMDSSALRLCIYFEQCRYEDAFLELDRLKHYLRNHKEIPKVHLNTIENFIRIYNVLLKYITNPEKTDIGFLEKDMNSLPLITNRKWLMEKIGEIQF